jgi:hypothetical protein
MYRWIVLCYAVAIVLCVCIGYLWNMYPRIVLCYAVAIVRKILIYRVTATVREECMSMTFFLGEYSRGSPYCENILIYKKQ